MISVGGVPVLGGRTVAVADIADASAAGRALLTAADEAAQRTALAAVRRGGALADASALPTPTADLLGAQYLLTGGVDGLGDPLLATCVTDDGVAYSWGLVPFGADVAGLRTALSVYSAAQVDAAVAAAEAAAIAASVPTSRTVAGVALSGDVSTAQIAAAVAAAPYSLSTTARLALSSPANGTRVYDSTVDRDFVRRNGLWIRDDGALLYGTQPGGDTSWTGVTLTAPALCTTAVSSGSVRFSQPANTVVPGGATAAIQVALAGIAASLACRAEWRLVPISGWSATSDLSYGGLVQTAYAKYMMHRCLGNRTISPWTDRYATDRQPGPQIASVGPDASNTQIWLALHSVGHRVAYQYGTGSAGAPPAPSAWTTYAVYDLLADDSITSTNTVSQQPVGDSLFSLNLEGTVGAGSSRVVDLAALTIYPLGGWR